MTANDARHPFVAFLWFLAHLIIGAIGVPVITSVGRYSLVLFVQSFNPALGLRWARWMEWILLETPYFPAQIVIGLVLGFELGRRFKHKAMLWIWVVPASIIVLLLLFAPFPEMVVNGVVLTRVEHFFGGRCLPQNHCFEQVGVTLPLYASVAYSLGAYVARQLSRTARSSDLSQGTLSRA